MTALETIGELYVENRRLLAEYGKLLGLVGQIKDGSINPAQVTVDLSGQNWSLTLTGEEFSKAVAEEDA